MQDAFRVAGMDATMRVTLCCAMGSAHAILRAIQGATEAAREGHPIKVVFQSKMVALSASVGQNVETGRCELVGLVPQSLEPSLGAGSDFRPSAPLLVRF